LITAYQIKNWAKFQHYKDRNPPWIKLHVEIFTSEDWVTLDDASKLLAVVCMVVAAKNEGKVPNNPAHLRRVAYLNSEPNLKPLVSCGFLVPIADDSTAHKVLADARPEKETDTEGEKERITSAAADPPKPEPQAEPKKDPYPEQFEAFWREYPTDPLMSKKKAHEQWRKLNQVDRDAARAAIPGFKDHCRKNPTYRPVHAERFISERRFDGFKAQAPDMEPEKLAELSDRIDKKLKRGKYDPMLQAQ